MQKKLFLASNIFLLTTLTACTNPNGFNNNVNAAQVSAVTVTVMDGTIASPADNTAQTYQTTSFNIKNGSCTKANIILANSENVKLKSCLTGNVLFLDTERSKLTKPNQTIRFYFNPLWQQGYTYQNISTNGQAHLINADIQIKILNTADNSKH